MTLWNMESHTLPGYYLASSSPVRLNSDEGKNGSCGPFT